MHRPGSILPLHQGEYLNVPNPFTPRGRMRRSVYLLVILAINLAVYIINLALVGAASKYGPHSSYEILASLAALAAAWPFYCAMSQRLHDSGYRNSVLAICAIGLVILSRIAAEIGPGMQNMPYAMIPLSLLACGVAISFWIMIAPPVRRTTMHGPDPRQRPATAL